MKVKRVLCFLIALALISLSVACVSDNGDNNKPSTTPAPTPSSTPGGGGAQKPDPGGTPTPQPTLEPTTSPGGGGSGGGSALSGSASDVLGKLVEDIRNAGVEMPMGFPGPPPEVAADLSHNTIGLQEDDFIKLVVSASYSQAAIGTFAHQISMIQAKDASSAVEVKKLVSGDDGFNPQKWICVWPDRVSVVEAGDYVLIAASKIDVVEAAIDIFKETAGSIGEVVTFWEFSD